MKPSKIVLFLLVLSFSLNAQDKYYMVKNFTVNDGLANNGIMSMAQDKSGYMWFGNDMGLSRFDGKTFYNKAVPEIHNNSAFVEYIETLSNGNIACTAFMQGVFIQQNGNNFGQYYRTPKRIGRNIFNSLKAYPDGSLLVAGAHLLFHLKDGKFNELFDYKSNQQVITTLELDGFNNIWFGGSLGLGVMLRTKSKLKPYFLPELKGKFIIKILFDKKGHILHVATSQGYYRLDFSKAYSWNKPYVITQPFPELSSSFINHIYINREGKLWIPTSTLGVFRIEGSRITLQLTKENGLISSTVTCVYQDREGNHWFGTSDGVSMIKNFNNYSLAYKGEQFNKANTITKDKFHRIWMRNMNGFYLLQNEKIEFLSTADTQLEEGGILDLVIDNQSTMWIANSLGLFKLHLSSQTPNLKQLIQVVNFKTKDVKRLKSIQLDSHGNLWLFMQNKLYCYSESKLFSCILNHPDSTSLRPIALSEDRWGNYWLGDFTFGLYRVKVSKTNSNTIALTNVKAYKCLKPDSSFVSAWVQDLAMDKAGNLWQASLYTGVYRLTIDSSGVKSYKLYNVSNGLSSNMVAGLQCDEKGHIWFFSQKGIDLLYRDSFSKKEEINHFNGTQDMFGQGFDALQYEGKIFLVFDQAVYLLNNDIYKKTTISIPKVFITNLNINGIPDRGLYNDNKTLELTHTQNNIGFEFSAISFKQAGNIQYQYMLEGADKGWSKITDRQVVEYSSLSTGKYIFKVRAINNEGAYGTVSKVAFNINPPFYNTVSFYLMMILVSSVILYALYKYKVSQLLKIERMRTRIASDLHDDIGSTLSSISLMSELIQKNSQKPLESNQLLSKIGENARNTLHAMDDIIWSVNPTNDKFENLQLRIREYAIPLLESRNIDFVMNVENTALLKLEIDQRKNLFLIIKESLNNAAKHSNCSKVILSFKITFSQLELHISDDGKGFDCNSSNNRNGLNNIKRRAEQIGAKLSIESSIGNGCHILLIMKKNSSM